MKTTTQIQDEVLNTGLILLATRKYHKMHQTEFAAILGVTQGTISKVENQLMAMDLLLWFRFVKAFKIKDPACFIDMNFEFHEKEFENLRVEGSNLAPNFDFKKGDYVCTIQALSPILEHIAKSSSSTPYVEEFFSRYKIQPEIFMIKNHPLPKDFVETFFGYLKEIRISDEVLNFIVPGFKKEDILNSKQRSAA